MRETRKSNHLPQTPNKAQSEKKVDALRLWIEQEYSKLYRQNHQTALKTVRHLLRHAAKSSPTPRSLVLSDLPMETRGFLFDDDEDHHHEGIETVSVVITDGNNQRPQKSSTIPTILPGVTSIRELIAYVPTLNNLAMRGHLTGIPYLGDKFDDDDQQIINSISGESSKSAKGSRKKKLDDQSLETLYQTVRSNETFKHYSNEDIVDEILHCHRDTSARARLLTIAGPSHRSNENIDTCDTIDVDINDLVVKSWCARFCARCYTYNCLLHTEKSIHFPLPKQYSISYDTAAPPCTALCYKHEREHLKRSLSPSHAQDSSHSNAEDERSEVNENVKKRARKSLSHSKAPNENHLDDHDQLTLIDQQKKFSSHFLTRIENHMKTHLSSRSHPTATDISDPWTLTDRSLFRLFYFLLDGDLCLIQQLFHANRTCQDLYQQYILDAKYFSDHLSTKHGSPLVLRRPYRRRMVEGATRAFLLHIKKHLNPNQKLNSTLKPVFQPCLHEGPCTKSNPHCHCMQRGTYCEKFCFCSIDCPHRFPGCACKGACLLNNCLCCAEGRECDPDLCHKCGASLFIQNAAEESTLMVKRESTDEGEERVERKSLPSLSRRATRGKASDQQLSTRQHSLRACRNIETSYRMTRPMVRRSASRASLTSQRPTTTASITCANISLQRRLHKQVLIAESDVAGYGAFLGSPIAHPGDLIAEYTGEIISEEEADRRGRLYDKQACSYLFNLDVERCVDARQYGGKIRFANHSSKPNCIPKIKLVNGDYRIGIYAKQTIYQGEELFFEYMYDPHQQQQFVNNERVDDSDQHGLTILKRFGDNFLLVRPS